MTISLPIGGRAANKNAIKWFTLPSPAFYDKLIFDEMTSYDSRVMISDCALVGGQWVYIRPASRRATLNYFDSSPRNRKFNPKLSDFNPVSIQENK